MDRLSTFLEKFKNLTPPERSIKKAAIDAVSKIVGVTLTNEQISIQRETLFFNTPSAVIKSEIMLHEKEILNAIEKSLSSEKKKIKVLR